MRLPWLPKTDGASMRAKLRAFQAARDGGDLKALEHDIDLLRHADLDHSIKAGALLTFNGLIIAAGINPIVASPGTPLSVDAHTDPLIALMTALGVLLMAVAASFSVRAILIGEDFNDRGLEDDPAAILQRLYAAYCAAIDLQSRMLAIAGRFTYAGGAVTALAFIWALGDKWFG
ncbi:MAG: hypothetical protein NW206_18405 [Hyphomonadaceae bacterium]|nr:hypothetical protein [Hyphomonadaceae bacterium]